LKILVDGEEIGFCIIEFFSRKPHTPTPDETARRKKNLSVYAPNWDYVPTGELRLSIEDLAYELSHIRSSWSDGKNRRIENCLGEVVAILPHVAKAVKLVREEKERARLQREVERRKAEEERRRQAEYDRKAKVVCEFVQGSKTASPFAHWRRLFKKKPKVRLFRTTKKQNLGNGTVDHSARRQHTSLGGFRLDDRRILRYSLAIRLLVLELFR
jgi:hypothetical protein